MGDDSYPKYRRRRPDEGGNTAQKNIRNRTWDIDNRWVVPYNAYLLKRFNCHINVEMCASIKAIKYVIKYVTKGSDQAIIQIVRDGPRDEIAQYLNTRYIGSCEAMWRLFQFKIHESWPPVQALAVHLPGGQRVYFSQDQAAQRARGPEPVTTLMGFFNLCTADSNAANLLYRDLPLHYVWVAGSKRWKRRVQRSRFALGRLHTVSPRLGECYFLRLLLNVVRGPKSFEDLRTVDGNVCTTFREACLRRGMLENDDHLHQALQEASIRCSSSRLRKLFIAIILHSQPSEPDKLWQEFSNELAEDFLHRHRQRINDPNAPMTNEIRNAALKDIAHQLYMESGRTPEQVGLPSPVGMETYQFVPEIYREQNHDIDQLNQYVNARLNTLTEEQLRVYNSFLAMIAAFENNSASVNDNIMFLDAPGGCGKSYLLNLLLCKVRSEGKIALATSSSNMAAGVLFDAGTFHATFNVPRNVHQMDTPVCQIPAGSAKATLIQQTSAIIVDEAPMLHKSCFEALDRTLKDIKGNDKLFGGIPILIAGDFRQIPPVVRGGTRGDIVQASLKRSFIWQHIKIFELKTNMRAHNSGDPNAQAFADLLLQLGEGRLPVVEDHDTIAIPEQLGNTVDTFAALKAAVYSDLQDNHQNMQWLAERTILSPLRAKVNAANDELTHEFPGTATDYFSINTANNDDEAVLYPTELLETIDLSGLPPHQLKLKVGMPILIIRAIQKPILTNGTRCVISNLHRNVIEATVSSGPYINEVVFIPRIPFVITPEDSGLGFGFRRLQFPFIVAFAMTINKGQGQTFKVLGVDLTQPCFTHGQLYVASSRNGSPCNLTFLAPTKKTRNVVFYELFD